MLPNPSEVEERHRNTIIITVLFTLKDPSKDATEKDNRIIIKKFASEVRCDELNSIQGAYIETVKPILPITHFDANKFFEECLEDFEELNLDLDEFKPEKLIYKAFETQESVGCPHYVCGCEQQCPTCKEFWGCRQCHSDDCDHKFDRKEVTTVRCRYCGTVQKFQITCEKCKHDFCSVYCEICKFMCFIGQDAKPFFHCDQCGTCRVGLKKNYIHCSKCNHCFYKDYFADHKCYSVEDKTCPVCLGTFNDTVFGIQSNDCGHHLHAHCYDGLLQKGIINCPLCKKYMLTKQQILEINKWNEEHVLTNNHHTMSQVNVHCNQCGHDFPQFESGQYFCHRCKTWNTEVVGDPFQPRGDEVGKYMKQYPKEERITAADILLRKVLRKVRDNVEDNPPLVEMALQTAPQNVLQIMLFSCQGNVDLAYRQLAPLK